MFFRFRYGFTAGFYLFKVSNEDMITICEVCSKLIIKTSERCFYFSDVSIVNFGRVYAAAVGRSPSKSIWLICQVSGTNYRSFDSWIVFILTYWFCLLIVLFDAGKTIYTFIRKYVKLRNSKMSTVDILITNWWTLNCMISRLIGLSSAVALFGCYSLW